MPCRKRNCLTSLFFPLSELRSHTEKSKSKNRAKEEEEEESRERERDGSVRSCNNSVLTGRPFVPGGVRPRSRPQRKRRRRSPWLRRRRSRRRKEIHSQTPRLQVLSLFSPPNSHFFTLYFTLHFCYFRALKLCFQF